MASNQASATRRILTGDARPSYQTGTNTAPKITYKTTTRSTSSSSGSKNSGWSAKSSQGSTKSGLYGKSTSTGNSRSTASKSGSSTTSKKLTGDARPSHQTGTNTAPKAQYKTTTKSGSTSKSNQASKSKSSTASKSGSASKSNQASKSSTASKSKSTSKSNQASKSSQKTPTQINREDAKKTAGKSVKSSTPAKSHNTPRAPISGVHIASSSSKSSSSKSSNKSSSKSKTGLKNVAATSAVLGTATAKKTASTNTNLTAKQITSWKTKVDNAISKKLIPSLSRAYDDAIQLGRVTENGEDSDNLNYRFKDLAQITDQAMKQLTTFLNSFDTNLTTYISTIEKAEKTTAEKLKKSIDQFAEAASKISKLKM